MDSIDSLSTDIYFDGNKEINKVQKGGNIDTEKLNNQLKSVIDHIKKHVITPVHYGQENYLFRLELYR